MSEYILIFSTHHGRIRKAHALRRTIAALTAVVRLYSHLQPDALLAPQLGNHCNEKQKISHNIIRLIAAHHHLCLASVAESVAISLLSLITTTTPNPGTQLPHSTGAVSHSERAELIKIGYAIRSLRMVAACDYNDDEQNKTTYRSAD